MSDTLKQQKIHVPIEREPKPSGLPIIRISKRDANVGIPIRDCLGAVAELSFLCQDRFYTLRTSSNTEGRGQGESVSRTVGFVGLVSGIKVVPKGSSIMLRSGNELTVEDQFNLAAQNTVQAHIKERSDAILEEFPWVSAFTTALRGTTWLAIYGADINGEADRIYEATLYIDESSDPYKPPTELITAHLDGIGPIPQTNMFEVLSAVLDFSKNYE